MKQSKIYVSLIFISILVLLSGCGEKKTETSNDSNLKNEKATVSEQELDEASGTQEEEKAEVPKDEVVDTEFSTQDVSDATIESIRTYDDYLTMYRMIIDDYFAKYEALIKDTILYDETTFQQMKDSYDESFEEQKKEYKDMGSKKIIGKENLVKFLKDYRDNLQKNLDSLEENLDIAG